jgi:hypothetical protein
MTWRTASRLGGRDACSRHVGVGVVRCDWSHSQGSGGRLSESGGTSSRPTESRRAISSTPTSPPTTSHIVIIEQTISPRAPTASLSTPQPGYFSCSSSVFNQHARAQHLTSFKICTDLPVPLAEPADVNNGGRS